jgi:hypothetical protein
LRRHSILLIALLGVGGLSAGVTALPAVAQEVGRAGNTTYSGVPYKVYADPGEATIRVYVVGSGANGVYEIGTDTRLDELLALTPTNVGSRSGDTEQRVTIRLYRTDDAGQRALMLERPLEDILQANPDTYPTLRERDLISVEVRSRQRFGWRDGLRILTSLASVILVIDRIGRY